MTAPELSLGATSQLYWEHRVVEAVATCARRLGPIADATPPVRADYEAVFTFFLAYVDTWHFLNEEKFFVPVLRGMGTTGSLLAVERIVAEHEESRLAFLAMKASYDAASTGDPQAAGVFDAQFTRYLDQLLEHLWLEDRYLYRLLQNALSSPAQRHLGWVLRHEPASEGRDGTPVEQEEVARRLCTRNGVTFPAWDQVLEGLEAEPTEMISVE